MRSTCRKLIIGALLGIAGIGGVLAFTTFRDAATGGQGSTGDLRPVRDITHGHGLTVDVADQNRLYIATHAGLLVLVNERNLYRVGRSEDDFMGFSAHPTDPKVFFSSGHPRRGGNLGIQRSDDGGMTWRRISTGVRGPVDFHAMAVSPANPDLLYGWYASALQRSTDGGKSWEVIGASLPNVIRLTADPERADVVYAATVEGLMVSTDRGVSWAPLGEELRGSAVTAVAVLPTRTQELIAFSDQFGLAKSTDGGTTWRSMAERFGGETPLHIAIARQRPDTVYVLTGGNSIFRSNDGGERWDRVRIAD